MTKIKCVNRWLVVKPLNPEVKTEGGIIMPDSAIERNDRAVIVSIADGWFNSDGDVFPSLMAEGEEVFYNKDRGVEVVEKDILESYGVKEGRTTVPYVRRPLL